MLTTRVRDITTTHEIVIALALKVQCKIYSAKILSTDKKNTRCKHNGHCTFHKVKVHNKQ